MKNVTLLLIGLLFLSNCAKQSKTTAPDYIPFITKIPYWQDVIFPGADSTDKITSIGIDKTDSFYGLFVYRSDTYSISVPQSEQYSIAVQNDATNGYSLTGYYDSITIHQNSGPGAGYTYQATLGKFQHLYGRYFYWLRFNSNHGTFKLAAYADSL